MSLENQNGESAELVTRGESEQSPTVNTETSKPKRLLYFLGFKALMQIVLSFAVLFGAVRFMDYLVLTQPEVQVRPKREQSFTVVTHPIKIEVNRPTLSLYGEIVTNRDVELRALVSGEIKSVSPKLKVGEILDKFAAIVTIDDFNYTGAVREAEANQLEAQARLDELKYSVEVQASSITSARDQLELAERDLQRSESLREKGNVTEQTLDSKKLVVSQREQSLNQLESNLKVAEAKVNQQTAALERNRWRLDQAMRNLENTTLKVPFDAVVKSQNAEVGRLVNVNDVLATLYDRNELAVRFTLSDEQYGRLLSETGSLDGKKVEVIWHIGEEPKSYTAVVDRIGALVASNRGGVDVFAKLQSDSPELLIRPGAFVEVRVPDISYDSSAVIPEEAVYDGTHVFVKSADSRMEMREITVHAYVGENAYVSGNLNDGEVLIVTHIAEAGEGILVNDIADPEFRAAAEDGSRTQGGSGSQDGDEKAGQRQGKGNQGGKEDSSAQATSDQ